MVGVRQKVLFEGLAKLRVAVSPDGTVRLAATVKGPGARALKKTVELLFQDLLRANDADFARMADEMRSG